jgi:hypothetical protein
MSVHDRAVPVLAALLMTTATAAATLPQPPPGLAEAAAEARKQLRERYPGEGARIDRGVDQAARYWRATDGDAGAFRKLAVDEFVPAGESLDRTFARLERAFERVGGYFTSAGRELREALEVDIGPILAIDHRLGAWDVGAHAYEDLFTTRVAFVVLLNFPLTSLEQRLREGGQWSRRQWAEARLAQGLINGIAPRSGARLEGFTTRVPAQVWAKTADAYSRADDYIANYNIYMHHLLAPDGKRLFPPGLRLISHWNLRDELKARYSDADGLPRQRMIQQVMERIVRQEIPAAVIDNPRLDWDPAANTVTVSPVADVPAAKGGPAEPREGREPDERYRRWMDVFAAERLADPFSPAHPTHIARRFNVDREISPAEVKALLEAVLESPLGAKAAALVSKRLGRPLEPFDIWYAGFKDRAKFSEAELDAITKKRYPTADAFAKDIPRILLDLGFSKERAQLLSDHIAVDPARGAGHAMGASRRDDKARLRTRVGKDGMDYKGYNIAVHELGHNVEQVFSLNLVDHTLLQGVPNTAFTEALAFVFQARDLELLGLAAPDAATERLRVLEDFWTTREIAGVGLVDMASWQWLYDHPDATPAEFRAAVVGIAQEIWNRHYAPLFGARDVPLLAIYSHLISNGLYTPDYPLGHLIAFQVEEHFKKKAGSLGAEFERICRQGAITPDAWIRGAVGGPLSAQPLLAATERALAAP